MQKSAFCGVQYTTEQARRQDHRKSGQKQRNIIQKRMKQHFPQRVVIEGQIAVHKPFQLVFQRDPMKFRQRIQIFLQRRQIDFIQ